MRGTLMNGITARATVKNDDDDHDDDKVTAADVGPGPVAEPAGGAPAAGPAHRARGRRVWCWMVR